MELGVTALSLGLVIPAFIVAFDRPELRGAPEVAALVARLGVPMQIVMAAALLVPMAAVVSIAVFLFWRRSDDSGLRRSIAQSAAHHVQRDSRWERPQPPGGAGLGEGRRVDADRQADGDVVRPARGPT